MRNEVIIEYPKVTKFLKGEFEMTRKKLLML
ncbi:unnamed protein product, partial [marine sediment metagenome]